MDVERRQRLPSDFLGNAIRVSLNEFVVHWQECPSYQRSEEQLQAQILQTVMSARSAAFCRFLAFSKRGKHSHMDLNASRNNIWPVPGLFQKIPAPTIQLVMSALQRMFTSQFSMAKSVIEFLSENSDYQDLFAMVTFPAIFFYFITDEFCESAEEFLEQILEIDRRSFAKSLIAAFFDGCPRFAETLWRMLDDLRARESSLTALTNAFDTALNQLTIHHARLIRVIGKLDRDFLCSFFFAHYLEPRAVIRYFAVNGESGKLTEIVALLKEASEPGTPVNTVMLDVLLRPRDGAAHQVSYQIDIGLPTVFTLLSEAEFVMLMKFLCTKGYVKSNNSYLAISDDEDVFAPGYVQFSMKRLFKKQITVKQAPILFSPRETTNERNPVYSRAWKKLKQIAEEEGDRPDSMIRKPKTMRCKDAVSLPLTQSIEFRSFLFKKMLNKAENSRQRFESFVRLLEVVKELELMKSDLVCEKRMYLWKFAHEFVVLKCMIPDRGGGREMQQQLPSSSVRFLVDRYKKSLPVDIGPRKKQAASRLPMKLRNASFEDLVSTIIQLEDNEEYVSYIILTLLEHCRARLENEAGMVTLYRAFTTSYRTSSANCADLVMMVKKHRCFCDLYERFDRLSKLELGKQIIELVYVVDSIFEVHPHLNLDRDVEDFACSCIVCCGQSNIVIAIHWFAKLVACYRAYLEHVVSSESISRMCGVARRLRDILCLWDCGLAQWVWNL